MALSSQNTSAYNVRSALNNNAPTQEGNDIRAEFGQFMACPIEQIEFLTAWLTAVHKLFLQPRSKVCKREVRAPPS
eukprot:36362-Eustigmatos_ZCMA.PRE.1